MEKHNNKLNVYLCTFIKNFVSLFMILPFYFKSILQNDIYQQDSY